MHEEPYRWLEAISNRREYIRDQLKGGTPVFAVSRPEGILLVGVGVGQSKVFEVFDRHGMAALGNPVDIERIRQTAIQAAHTESFQRSSQDVTLRRLVNFSLSYALKSQFEQVYASPLIAETIFAEVGPTPESDTLVRLRFDGTPQFPDGGVAVACATPEPEAVATQWLIETLEEADSLNRVATKCLAVWKAITEDTLAKGIQTPKSNIRGIPGKTLEIALLDREAPPARRYQPFDLAAKGNSREKKPD